MSLHLYNTATRNVSEFKPLTPGKVGIYLCGATVQAPPHIGHIRSGVNFDILRRWLMASGFDVNFIRKGHGHRLSHEGFIQGAISGDDLSDVARLS